MTRVLVREAQGAVRVSEAALTGIVRQAVSSVDGARLRKGRRRLGVELEVVGVPTTREAALDILASEEFRSGRYSTSFLDEAGARLPALAAAS